MGIGRNEEATVSRKSQVSEQHDFYKELVKDLHESIGILRAHLEPVLTNHPTPTESSKALKENLVPLAASLCQINTELKEGIFKIKDICNSIEL